MLTLYAIGFFFSVLSVVLIFSGDARLGWPVVLAAVTMAFGVARWLGYLGPPLHGTTPVAQKKNLLLRRALHTLERRLRKAHSEEQISHAVAEFDLAASRALGVQMAESERGVRFAIAAQVAAARARRLG